MKLDQSLKMKVKASRITGNGSLADAQEMGILYIWRLLRECECGESLEDHLEAFTERVLEMEDKYQELYGEN